VNAAGLLLDRGDRILRRGVDRDLGAEFPREGELVLRDVDRATRRPIATAYCTAMCPSPPMPEIATHCPGRVPVHLRPL